MTDTTALPDKVRSFLTTSYSCSLVPGLHPGFCHCKKKSCGVDPGNKATIAVCLVAECDTARGIGGGLWGCVCNRVYWVTS